MFIRLIKSLPAPLMDGFDLRRFHVDGVYEVDEILGRYLSTTGYATVEEKPDDNAAPPGSTTRDRV
jgi:hypothetical protein